MLWCPIRVYAGIGVVVVGGREVLLFKFSTFHSIENTCKKIFLWEYLPGGGGGLSPQSHPPPPPLDPPLNMTGQKIPVQVMHKLGHSISYAKTCEIETASAELSIKQSKEKMNILPLLPSGDEIVLTYFWVDNFDVKVEKKTGSGMVHTTHLMAFQEAATVNCSCVPDGVQMTNSQEVPGAIPEFERSGRRRLLHDAQLKTVNTYKVCSRPEPLKFDSIVNIGYSNSDDDFHKLFFLWVLFRHKNTLDQIVPNLSGWLLQLRQRQIPTSSLVKTEETYLPPIASKVNEFTTIETYIEYLENLSLSCNMPYLNITLDVGATMNAFKFVWSNPE